jgi:cytidylate kinase
MLFLTEPINITIDGLTATGKSVVGKLLSDNLNYRFIDTGLIYRYLAKHLYNYTEEQKIITCTSSILNIWLTCNIDNFIEEINSINDLEKEEYLKIGKKASEISKIQQVRDLINNFFKEITKEKGFVLAGRDTTFNILPDSVKIVLDADINTRVNRRADQTELLINDIYLDIIKRDNDSVKLIEQAKKVSKVIDTTELDIEQVLEIIFNIISKQVFLSKFQKIYKIIIFIIILFLYKYFSRNLTSTN